MFEKKTTILFLILCTLKIYLYLCQSKLITIYLIWVILQGNREREEVFFLKR